MLWSASSLKAVRCCGRMLHNDGVGDPDDGQAVAIKRRPVDGRMVASYSGLMTCGSVWSCPRCSAVIAHERAAEIGSAVRECYRRGGRAYLLTLTMRHSSRDKLTDLWEALSTGWRNAFGARAWTGQKAGIRLRRGRLVETLPVMGDAERFDVAGLTRVVEATYGRPDHGGHGWHLHIHALVFSSTSMEAGIEEELPDYLPEGLDRHWLARAVFARRIYERWSGGLGKLGFGNLTGNAVDLREITDDGSEYVGRYLSKATYDAAAKLGMEIGGGQLSKDAKEPRNRTPFNILAELTSSVDARGFGVRTPRHWSVKAAGDGDWAVIDSDTGEVMAVTPPGEWRIWHEWEQASKGRRQILWSRRRKEPASRREELWNALLDARGVTAQASDDELAAREVGGESLGEIHRADWYRVIAWRPELQVRVLEVAETGDVTALTRLLAAHGVVLARNHRQDRRRTPHEPLGIRCSE